MASKTDQLSLFDLEELSTSVELHDRAFVASALALRDGPEPLAEVARVYERVRDTSLRVHAATREAIREKAFDGAALLAALARTPLELRDHWIDEILDLAYPPLDAPAPPRHLLTNPSGFAEILFLLQHAELDARRTFVDLGAGAGKVVLLVALLGGAKALGIELLPELVARAESAAAGLALDNARFVRGDLLGMPLPDADVYYLFMSGPRPAEIAARLEPIARSRKFLLFSQALDRQRFRWLKRRNAASYWLELYESEPA